MNEDTTTKEHWLDLVAHHPLGKAIRLLEEMQEQKLCIAAECAEEIAKLEGGK